MQMISNKTRLTPLTCVLQGSVNSFVLRRGDLTDHLTTLDRAEHLAPLDGAEHGKEGARRPLHSEPLASEPATCHAPVVSSIDNLYYKIESCKLIDRTAI